MERGSSMGALSPLTKKLLIPINSLVSYLPTSTPGELNWLVMEAIPTTDKIGLFSADAGVKLAFKAYFFTIIHVLVLAFVIGGPTITYFK